MSAANSNGSAKKKVGRPFAKGQSGNPSGRPKVIGEVRDLAREHTLEAIATLADALKDIDGRVRVAAANALLDRAYGKPAQAITGPGGGPVEMITTDVDLTRLTIAELTMMRDLLSKAQK